MMEQLVGQSLKGRYRLDRLQGEGGMGAVFKARDLTLQRDVAVKIMHPRYARQPTFRERFLQEARAAAALDHPGIVRVHDFGEAQSYLFIVMEFIAGDDLRQMLQDLKATNQWVVLSEAVQLLRQVCLAIDYAHHQGVLHRDIKPDNVMVKPEPAEGLPYRPVLTDLGLAKLAGGEQLTQEGTSMGTPAYMSPEQALGEETDARSDVYSLGILLFELSTGQLPFRVRTITEAIRSHAHQPPPPPRSIRPELPQLLTDLILKALEKDPDDRFPSAMALAEALAQIPSAATEIAASPTFPQGNVSLLTQHQQSLVRERGPSILDEFPDLATDPTQDHILVLDADQTMRAVTMKPQGLTIGRGADNDVVIDNPSVSRRHARVDFDGTSYEVTDLDSTNGTFLANVKLLPGVPGLWTPEKPVRIGNTWLRLQRASQPARPAGPTIFRSDGTMIAPSMIRSSAGTGRVGLFLEETSLSVEPGSSTMVQFVVLNQGSLVDHFEVTVEGIPKEWVQAPTAALRLLPGVHQDVQATFRPPRSLQSRAGEYPLTIRVTSRDAPDEVAEVSLPLTVTAFYEVSLDLRPRKQRGMSEGTFQVHVSNRGNADVTVRLEAVDPEDGCQYAFDPAQMDLPPGDERTAQLRVRPRTTVPSTLGRSYYFTVTARAVEAPHLSQQVQGEWAQTPPVFEMSLRPQRARGLAEGHFRLHINNHSDASLDLRLEATDPEEGCLYILEPAELALPPGQEKLVQLRVRPRRPLSSTASRTYDFTVTARPAEAPSLTRQVHGEWVHSAPALDLDIQPQRQERPTEGMFRLQINNRGETSLTVQLDATDPARGCFYTFHPSRAEVPAGQDRLVELKVRGRGSPPTTGSRSHAFTVTAQPVEAPRLTWQVQGEWVQIPAPRPAPAAKPPAAAPTKPKRRWVPGCLIALVGLAVTAGLGYLAGNWAYEELFYYSGGLEPLLVACAVWFIGLILSLRWALKVWRDEPSGSAVPQPPAPAKPQQRRGAAIFVLIIGLALTAGVSLAVGSFLETPEAVFVPGFVGLLISLNLAARLWRGKK
jgi:serine/threonine protein kinase/uncharacterized membrane protein